MPSWERKVKTCVLDVIFFAPNLFERSHVLFQQGRTWGCLLSGGLRGDLILQGPKASSVPSLALSFHTVLDCVPQAPKH